MQKYAKIENTETYAVSIGTGTNYAFYQSIGMTLMDVEQGYDGQWYVAGHAPKQPIEEIRAVKLSELSGKFSAAEAEAHLTSSLGIVINAGEKANRDIDGLVKLMEAMPDMKTVDFCCYDNSFKSVTLADLKTMQIEVILSGNDLYAQKWAYREAINAAQSKEELEAIAIEFTYSDFSEQAEAGEFAEVMQDKADNSEQPEQAEATE